MNLKVLFLVAAVALADASTPHLADDVILFLPPLPRRCLSSPGTFLGIWVM